MAGRYDTRTTMFSPDGRLHQVEYAMETVNGAGTCLGILTNDGVLLAAERLRGDTLLDEEVSLEKIYKLNDDVVCGVAGIGSDAHILIQEGRLVAQRYLKIYDEPIPCEQLVSMVCDLKQAYTQYGGKRPFGVSILYMGWDKHLGYQLYKSDPNGNYGGWKAVCVGRRSADARILLTQEYMEGEMTLQKAQPLAIKVLCKTLDMKNVPPEKVEMVMLTRDLSGTAIHVLNNTEIGELIKECAEPKPEPELKEKN